MAVKEICRMGNPVLREIARDIPLAEIGNSEFLALLQDMEDTMKSLGGIGIAAPQIGVSKKLAIIEFDKENPRYKIDSDQERLIVVNPRIEILDSSLQGFWEGCLSVPGLRGFVERPRKIKLVYLNEKAQKRELIVEDFLATVTQHELDHLFGKLYIDQMSDLSQLCFEKEFAQFYLED